MVREFGSHEISCPQSEALQAPLESDKCKDGEVMRDAGVFGTSGATAALVRRTGPYGLSCRRNA